MSKKNNRFIDPSVNNFVKTNLYYTNNPYFLYEDPTMLGFKLFFHFDQPDSGLLSTKKEHTNTAYSYLLRIGEHTRANLLLKFINHLKNINSLTPWYFQSIKGLSDAWKHNFNDSEMSIGFNDGEDGEKIKIECLEESVDFRLTALLDLYRKSCFDWVNHREIVPKNLRQFKVSIYVYESRFFNISSTPNQNNYLIPNVGNVKPEKIEQNLKLFGNLQLDVDNELDYKEDFINENISRVLFNFENCELLPDENAEFFGEFGELQHKKPTIAFNYKSVYEENLYTIWSDNKIVSDVMIAYLDNIALDNPEVYNITDIDDGNIFSEDLTVPRNIQSMKEKLKDKFSKDNIKNTIKDRFDKTLDAYKNAILDTTASYNFGNVYGIDDSILSDIQNKTQINPAILNKLVDKAKSPIEAKVKKLFLGNVYGFSASRTVEKLKPDNFLSNI